MLNILGRNYYCEVITVSWEEDWSNDLQGDEEDYDLGPGIDCDDDGGLDNIEYGGSYKDIELGQNENEDNAEEDYNFGYGGNRHNRESGSRFHGLGRWRRRE